MDFDLIVEYIDLMIVLVCFVVGWVIKNIIPSEAVNKYIPLILCVLGVVFTAWEQMAFTPEIVAVGLVSGWASTGIYETIRTIDLNKIFKKGE